MNILILAGGANKTTDSYPDYLSEMCGSSVIEQIFRKLEPLCPSKIICLFPKVEVERFHLKNMIQQLSDVACVIPIQTETMGAACTALLSIGEVDFEEELLIVNTNEIVDLCFPTLIENFRERDLDCGIVTHNSVHPRYSYARITEGVVTEVSEKNPISKNALVGVYWYKTASHFFDSVKEMIRKDFVVNGDFYISPSINEMILKQRIVGNCVISSQQYIQLKDHNKNSVVR